MSQKLKLLGNKEFRGCLVCVFKQLFSVFKQHFTHFNVLFHPHVFSQMFSNNNFQFLNTYTKRALNHCGPKILGFELRITCSYSMIYYWLYQKLNLLENGEFNTLPLTKRVLYSTYLCLVFQWFLIPIFGFEGIIMQYLEYEWG